LTASTVYSFAEAGRSNRGTYGTIQSFSVPSTGWYLVHTKGASPANQTYSNPNYPGGKPANISAFIWLIASEQIQILVGQYPDTAPFHGGAGGSFVVSSTNDPLVIAGGGGSVRSGDCNGQFGSAGGTVDMVDASLVTAIGQSDGKSNNTNAGGTGGNAGEDLVQYEGQAGSGFYQDAPITSVGGTDVYFAKSWANGMTGGLFNNNSGSPTGGAGGFGGGGAGGWGGSGAGGGYNGGGAGHNCTSNYGGGGGSFITNTFNGAAAVFHSSSLGGYGLQPGQVNITKYI
jgi:hypothetical protein